MPTAPPLVGIPAPAFAKPARSSVIPGVPDMRKPAKMYHPNGGGPTKLDKYF